MYALVEIRGKQYKAEKGSLLKIDRLSELPALIEKINTEARPK